MRFVPAICTQCGSKLETDPSKETAICPYCSTSFITEKAINNYNTTNVTNVHADVVKISDAHTRDRLAKAGDTFVAMKDYDKARENFVQLCEEYPYDYRGWWGLIKVITENFEKSDITRMELIECKALQKRAAEVATAKEKDSMDIKFKPYFDENQSKLDMLVSNTNEKIEAVKEKYGGDIKRVHERKRIATEEKKKIKDYSGPIIGVLVCAVVIVSLCVSLYDGSNFFLGLLFCGIIAVVVGFLPVAAAEGAFKSAVSAKDKEIASIEEQLNNLYRQRSEEIRKLQEIKKGGMYPIECRGFSLGKKLFLSIGEEEARYYREQFNKQVVDV